jgi:hypothetical protein
MLFSGTFFVGLVAVVEDRRSEAAPNLARAPQFIVLEYRGLNCGEKRVVLKRMG